jgi:elongation factor 3
MSEGAISESLQSALNEYKISLDESEAEYISGSVWSCLDEVKRSTPSKPMLSDLLATIMDILSPSISEHISVDADTVVHDISMKLLCVMFADAKKILDPDHSSESGSVEIPLLDLKDFTLAYMGLELLRHTSLSVLPGRIYGLVGKNGVGKTTLMNKLANGEIPGFPRNCVTAMVRHELVGALREMTPREIISDSAILAEVGFVGKDALLADTPCSNLSGGWRMRTSIAIALSKGQVDLLLLDEPTNHLDRECVAWLVSFLKSLKNTAVIIVSHDEEFLNNTIDYVIYFFNLKLKIVRSNLTDFIRSENLDPVNLVPLNVSPDTIIHTPAALPIRLPKPGDLDGVRSMTQTIAKLEDVSFTYPGERKAGVYNVSGRVSLSSRIALSGPNGAGKSTLVSLLVGSLTPDSGTVYRHPNLRIAFVSQHHVHHLEEFLNKPCLEYFVDRFGGGLDKEVMKLESIQETGFEQLDRVAKAKKFAAKCGGRSGNGGVECLLGRRKEGREYSYEVQWAGWRADQTDWIPRSVLETELGVGKLCLALDAVLAQKKSGTDQRGLDYTSIKKYLQSFGLAPHVAEGRIGGLSGGQKSRLTLAAAMWTYPHMIVLDEPTNYLDASSLDTLLDSISHFGGAVVVISHNKPFMDRFAKQIWHLEEGRLVGQSDLQ